MNKKKILFIIWSFGGGAGVILSNIVNKLDPEKYDIDIFRYYKGSYPDPFFKSNIRVLNNAINDNTSMFIRKVYYFLLLFLPFIMRWFFIKKKYDVEIASNYLVPTFLLSKSKKVKKIAWIQGSVFDLENNIRDRFFQKRAFRNADRIISISKLANDSILKVFPETKDKLELIYNGYDFDSIIKKSNMFNISFPKNNILFLNRFDDNKNPLFAIEVAKILHDRHINFSMTFIGPGDSKMMKEKIKEYSLSKYVKILGFKKNPYPYIKGSKIIICCSHFEGLPTILAESLILGKPFVTTNVGGALDLSDNQKCGLIAENIIDFADKIEMLLSDSKMYNKYSKHGINFINKFKIDKQVVAFEKIWNFEITK